MVALPPDSYYRKAFSENKASIYEVFFNNLKEKLLIWYPSGNQGFPDGKAEG